MGVLKSSLFSEDEESLSADSSLSQFPRSERQRPDVYWCTQSSVKLRVTWCLTGVGSKVPSDVCSGCSDCPDCSACSDCKASLSELTGLDMCGWTVIREGIKWSRPNEGVTSRLCTGTLEGSK